MWMDLTVVGTPGPGFQWTPADRARHGDVRLYTWTEGRRVFEYPLCASDEAERLKAELSDTTVRHLLARLRSIDPSEVRCALTSSQFAAPLADGVLVANTKVLPVGDTLVPFFQELIG